MQKYTKKNVRPFQKKFLREVKEISHVQQDRVQEVGSAIFRLHVLV